MEEDKTQHQQAKHQRVFFWFGDDLAVDYRPHVAKTGMCASPVERSRMKIADGFVQNAGAYPRRRVQLGIRQTAEYANPQGVSKGVVIHKKVRDGLGSAADGDGGRVGGAGDEGGIGFAAAGNSGIDRSDVFGVGARKQGRESQHLAGGVVGVVKVAVVGESPRVSIGVYVVG